MTTTLTMAPVRKTIRVRATQARAFEVFTAGLHKWWPRDHGIVGSPIAQNVFEAKAGGRWCASSKHLGQIGA